MKFDSTRGKYKLLLCVVNVLNKEFILSMFMHHKCIFMIGYEALDLFVIDIVFYIMMCGALWMTLVPSKQRCRMIITK